MVWVAGEGDGEGVVGTDVSFSQPLDVAIDVDGSVLVVERSGAQRLRRIRVDGTLETIVPSLGDDYGTGIPAEAAGLFRAQGVTADADSIFVSDDQRVRRIDKGSGLIEHFAGNGVRQCVGDGAAPGTSVADPVGLVADGAGGVFVAEVGCNVVRHVSGGVMDTVAGTTGAAFGGDGGPAVLALLFQPADVVFDGAGGLLIADSLNHRVRRVDASGVITTIAGNGTAGFGGDGGPAVSASLLRPTSVAVDAAGNVFISDTGNDVIRRVDVSGVITTVAGTGVEGFGGDGGPAVLAEFDAPRGIAVDGVGRVVVADGNNDRVRRFVVGGDIETIGGNGRRWFSVTNGPAREAGVGFKARVSLDSDGSVLVSDRNMIRRLDESGMFTQFAGTGESGYSGDGGDATLAQIGKGDVAVDSAGNRYLADTGNHVIRRIDPNGVITTIAGNGTYGFAGDGGPAVSAMLGVPRGVVVDAAGNIFFGDGGRVRRIDPAGTITTIAGTGTGTIGDEYSGDGGPAVDAVFSLVIDLALDAAGNLYVADFRNRVVRKIDTAGIVTTFTTEHGGRGVSSVAVDPDGNVFYTARNLYKVDTAGETSIVAGPKDGYAALTTGGSPASAVDTGDLWDVAVAANGDVYVAATVLADDIGFTAPSWVYRIEAAATADLRSYVPTTPVPTRIVDTRVGTGAPAAPLQPGDELSVEIAGRHDVDIDATAVVVNVTAPRAQAGGYVSVYPCGRRPDPITSVVNTAEDRIVANATVSRLGTNGSICVTSNITTDIVIDLQGWYPANSEYKPIDPVRIGDSRDAVGFSARLEAGTVTPLRVAGRNGVPYDATAAVFNMTAANPADAGYITAFACGGQEPSASNLNTWPGHAIANLAITDIGDSGSVCFYSSVDTELIIDLTGWYPLASAYEPRNPQRLVDTRETSPLQPGDELVVETFLSPDRPGTAVAAVNVTTVRSSADNTYVVVYPCGQDVPLASNNNTSTDRTVATLALVPLGTDENICITTSASTDIIVDLNGWYPST